MPTHIEMPSIVPAAGHPPKRIEEYVGRVNSGHATVSVARMISPAGWEEPGQRPAFEEITLVLRGTLRVEHAGGEMLVRAGEVVVAHPGEWVRYGTPDRGGAEYVAICVPAFTPAAVRRDEVAVG
jgi:quercetin dioxygenase-like cupin family protein